MKMISKVNGPITTSIAQSSFDPTGQDFIVAYKIDRECFLSQIKEKVSTELWFSIMEYEKECLNPFLTNYLFHILELHRLHARNYEGVLDDVKQFLSGFDDVVDNETKVT